jgi:hypothetical protein
VNSKWSGSHSGGSVSLENTPRVRRMPHCTELRRLEVRERSPLHGKHTAAQLQRLLRDIHCRKHVGIVDAKSSGE